MFVQSVAKHIYNGGVDMTSKIHVAIPPNTQILTDLGAGYLHVGFIEGNYSRSDDHETLQETEFGTNWQETVIHKKVHWGKKGLPFNQTKTLQEIYDAEGEFTITAMEIQCPYEKKVVTNGVPQIIKSIACFMFKSWSFKPKMILKILDRMPSAAIYRRFQTMRNKWKLNKETQKRQRDTWLINKPQEGVPMYVYKFWLDTSFAMILPESSSTFQGRELGADYKEMF